MTCGAQNAGGERARIVPWLQETRGVTGSILLSPPASLPTERSQGLLYESGDPSSPHFNDEAERYATGNLREVYFYKDQLKGHIERQYRPGQ